MAQYALFLVCLILIETCQPISNVKKDDEEIAKMVTMVSSAKLKTNDFLQMLRTNLNLSESNSQNNPGTEKPSKVETKSVIVQKKEDEISPNLKNTEFKSGTQASITSNQKGHEMKSLAEAPITSNLTDTGLDIVSPRSKVSTLDPVLEVRGSNPTSAIVERKDKINTASDVQNVDTAAPVINISTPSLGKGKTTEKKENNSSDKVEPNPAVKMIDPDDNTAEEDLFLEENSRSSSVSQHHDEYEQEEDNWYKDTNILDSKETTEDEDEWDFWNDHHEVVTEEKSNIADKFGDFWDEQSYARGPYLKEAIMTSSSVEDRRQQVRREMNLMTFYSWLLFIALSLLLLYVFYRQKNVFKPYWSYLYQSSPVKRRLSSEDTAEERKGLVHHAYA